MLPQFKSPLLMCVSVLLLTACAGTHYQPQALTGQVAYLEKITLPTETTLVHLRLLNVSGSGGAAGLLGEQFINRPAHFPVPFAVRYDQLAISATGHYELNTQVYADGQLKMQNTTSLQPLAGSLPASVDVVVKSVGQ